MINWTAAVAKAVTSLVLWMSWPRTNNSLVVPSAWRKVTHSRTLPVTRLAIQSARTRANYPLIIDRGKVRCEVASLSRTGEGRNVSRCRGGGVSNPGRRGSGGPPSSSHSSPGLRLVNRGAEAASDASLHPFCESTDDGVVSGKKSFCYFEQSCAAQEETHDQ